MTNQTLLKLFAKFGFVHSAKVSVNNISGENCSFGYVEMEYQSEAQLAVDKLNGFVIEGRNIGVSPAISERKNQRI